MILVFIEHKDCVLNKTSLEAITAAQTLGKELGLSVAAVIPCGSECVLANEIANYEIAKVIVAKNEKLGTVLMMEVGALMVGKIRNYKKERCQVKRGEEKGRFEFGGSTVVLLLEPDKVLPDSDLIRNTLQGAETIVKMGERIGGVVCLEKNSSI